MGDKVTPVGVDRDLIAPMIPCVNVGPIGKGIGTKMQEGTWPKGEPLQLKEATEENCMEFHV
jgi:hypothetical protein